MPTLTEIEKNKRKYTSSPAVSSIKQELNDNPDKNIDYLEEYFSDKVDSIIGLFMENGNLSSKSSNDLEDECVDGDLKCKKAMREGNFEGANFKKIKTNISNEEIQTSEIRETVRSVELNSAGYDAGKQLILQNNNNNNSGCNDQTDSESLNDDTSDIQIRPLSALHTRDLTTNQGKKIYSSYPVTEPIGQPEENFFKRTELNGKVITHINNDLQDNAEKRSDFSRHSSTWGDGESFIQRFGCQSNEALAFINDKSVSALNTEYGKEAFIATPVVPYSISSQRSRVRDISGEDALSKRTSIKNWRFGDIDGLERTSSLKSSKSGNSTLRNDKYQRHNDMGAADESTERKRSVSFRIPEPLDEKNNNNIPLINDDLKLGSKNSNFWKYVSYGLISGILAICLLILSLKAFDVQKRPVVTEDDFVSYFNSSSNSTKIRLVSNLLESYELQNSFISKEKKEIKGKKNNFLPRHNDKLLLQSQNSFIEINSKYSDDDEIKQLMRNDDLRLLFSSMAYAPAGVIEPHCDATQRNVLLDIVRLSTITSRVRTYGTQCKQAEFILEAIKQLQVNMTLSLGVWIGADTVINNIQMQEMKDLLLKYPKEYFYSIYIGNEVLFRGDISVKKLMEYVKETKSYLVNIGYADIPVGTSELGSQINEEMLRECDFVGANIHPFFGGVEADCGTKWTLDYYYHQLIPMRDSFNLTTNIIVSEVGWPYDGGQYLKAVSGPIQYQQFLNDWLCTAPAELLKDCVYFEAFDEPWKRIWWDENKKWETEWGFFTSDRQVKNHVHSPDCSKYTQSFKNRGGI